MDKLTDEIAKIGLIVVRVRKNTKPKLWKIIGNSNVFHENFVCDAKDELLNHFHRNEVRLATNAEIKLGRRIDANNP